LKDYLNQHTKDKFLLSAVLKEMLAQMASRAKDVTMEDENVTAIPNTEDESMMIIQSFGIECTDIERMF
jgi:hypothetical protein